MVEEREDGRGRRLRRLRRRWVEAGTSNVEGDFVGENNSGGWKGYGGRRSSNE